jgi:hypothetical protein
MRASSAVLPNKQPVKPHGHGTILAAAVTLAAAVPVTAAAVLAAAAALVAAVPVTAAAVLAAAAAVDAAAATPAAASGACARCCCESSHLDQAHTISVCIKMITATCPDLCDLASVCV